MRHTVCEQMGRMFDVSGSRLTQQLLTETAPHNPAHQVQGEMRWTRSLGELDGRRARNVSSWRLTRNIALKEQCPALKTNSWAADKHGCTHRPHQG